MGRPITNVDVEARSKLILRMSHPLDDYEIFGMDTGTRINLDFDGQRSTSYVPPTGNTLAYLELVIAQTFYDNHSIGHANFGTYDPSPIYCQQSIHD